MKTKVFKMTSMKSPDWLREEIQQPGLGGFQISLTECIHVEANHHSVCHQEEVSLADSQDECGVRHSKLMSSKPFFNKPNSEFHVCVYFTVSQLKK